MRRSFRRRAVTLVEALVFGTIGMAAIASAWSIFRHASRQGLATDQKLQALQSVLLLSIRLEEDLVALHEDPLHLMDYQVSTAGSRLSFYRLRPGVPGDAWEPTPLQQVTYRFDLASGKVYRQVDGGTPQRLFGDFERLNYRIADRAPDPSSGLLPEAPALIYSVVGAASEARTRPEAERKPWDRSVAVGGIPRTRTGLPSAYPFWNPVPYGPNS